MIEIGNYRDYFNDLIYGLLPPKLEQRPSFKKLSPFEQWKQTTRGKMQQRDEAVPEAIEAEDTPGCSSKAVAVLEPILPHLCEKSYAARKGQRQGERRPLLMNRYDEERFAFILLPHASSSGEHIRIANTRLIQDDVNEVGYMTNDAIQKLLHRGEKMTEIQRRANNLKSVGSLFKKKMVNIERETFVQSMKQSTIIASLGFWAVFCTIFIVATILIWVFRFIYGWDHAYVIIIDSF